MTPMYLQPGSQFNFGRMLSPQGPNQMQPTAPIARPIGSTLNLGSLMQPQPPMQPPIARPFGPFPQPGAPGMPGAPGAPVMPPIAHPISPIGGPYMPPISHPLFGSLPPRRQF